MSLARVLIDELDDDALEALADRLALRLAGRVAQSEPRDDGWLDAKRAAAYLGITTNALHKLTATRAIPFEQDGPCCKLWFRRSVLDAWREHGGARAKRAPTTNGTATRAARRRPA